MSYTNHKFESNDWYHFGFDVWYKVENVRNLKTEIARMHASNKRYLMKSKHDGMLIDDLVDSYLKTSDVKNINCMKYKKTTTNKKHQKRYGSYFLIHLGKNYGLNLQVKILHEFIKQVCYGEENLPYFATTSKNGNHTYIHLWICDREYIKDEARVYESDYWQKDGKRCKANIPGAVLLHEKGDIQLDKDGNPKMLNGWRQTKTRIFAESWKTSAKRWRDAFVAVFYCVLRRTEPMLKFKLKPMSYDVELAIVESDIEAIKSKHPEMSDAMARKQLEFERYQNDKQSKQDREFIKVNRSAAEWKNIKYREIASLQYFIKHVIHELMSDDIDNWKNHEPDSWNGRRYIDFDNPPTALSNSLRDLFKKYNQIFNKWEYTSIDGEPRKIMFAPNEEVIPNIRELRDKFKHQINSILKKYKPALAY
ncbi:hypothetical protein G7061_07080 [Erysipelothrix sp. HDW6B]|uniref:hypothetical protein n=1 Tax=Erysipelothrix sp. HDW6B TaxID=2714929 RepID=UPI00140BACDC|nr:hypothetical protein [Erysipelothrix sp. HDW6B]QIK86386.1 hypothetical protein G7061_07080 [Erysipelothrix sp. HDW6B]